MEDEVAVVQPEPRFGRVGRIWNAITVEPVLFIYMFTFMFTTVVEQAFYVHRGCLVNMGFNETICNNLREHNETNKLVQKTVSTFVQYNSIASNVVPFIIAVFLGAWSDRRGRKLLLLFGLAGQIYYFFMMWLNAVKESWPLETIIWTATFPSSLTGANLAVFASAFSYLADVTSVEDRTMRTAILDGTYLLSMPTGIAAGAYVFKKWVKESYSAMFAINCVLMSVAFLYALVKLKWHTTPAQTWLHAGGWCRDFFDLQYVKAAFRAVTKKRKGKRRLYLFLVLLSMGLYTFQRNERTMSYLYTQLKFKWSYETYSYFRTFQTSLYVVVTLLVAPLLTKCCGVRDVIIVLIGAPAHAIARVIFALAQNSAMFYVGAAVSSLGPSVAPVLRSMTSKIVSAEDRGAVFAVLTVADSAVPLLSSPIYSQVYNATVDVYPAAFYWVTVIMDDLSEIPRPNMAANAGVGVDSTTRTPPLTPPLAAMFGPGIKRQSSIEIFGGTPANCERNADCGISSKTHEAARSCFFGEIMQSLK